MNVSICFNLWAKVVESILLVILGSALSVLGIIQKDGK